MDPLAWATILLGLGLVLIVVELFVPSGGIIGAVSAMTLVAAVVVAFTGGPRSGVIILVAAVIIVPALLGFLIGTWPDTPLGRLMLIQLPDDESEMLPDSEHLQELKQLIGQTGRAKTSMRPSGVVLVAGRTFDASTPGMSIDAGETIRVTAINMGRLTVQPCEAPTSPQPLAPPTYDDPLAQPFEQFGIEPLDDPLA